LSASCWGSRFGRNGSRRRWWIAGLALAGLTGLLHAAGPVITEFVAANGTGLRDADGEFSDWIEVHNPEATVASLAGWFLTDDAQNPTQWQLPAVTVPEHGFLVVFASGKNRAPATGELHTNFKLSRDGGYLALVRPDGHTVATEFTPAYPRQIADVSYGTAMVAQTDRLVVSNAVARLHVPTDDRYGQAWRQPGFDDTAWTPLTMSLGYNRPQAGSPEPVEQPPTLGDVTQPDDLIVPTSLNSPGGEDVLKAIDNNPQTKYLNFDKLNAGLTVTLGAGKSVVTGLRLTSANDAPERDPTSYVLAGSNDGQPFVEIARGSVPQFLNRFTAVSVSFTNSTAYQHYRLLFPTVRNAASAVAVQIAEIELLGSVGGPAEDFANLIRTDLESVLYGKSASAFVRLPFTVADGFVPARLTLRLRHEDGFVAFLNGVEVARANAPQSLAFNSAAVTNRLRLEAAREQQFNLSGFASLLRPGANVLAIQGLNSRADSRDFLLSAQLDNTRLSLGERGYFAPPTPGSENAAVPGGLVAEVGVSSPRGFYAAPINVTLTCPTELATIRYTTNGSLPSAGNGLTYSGPIRITQTTALRAVALRPDWRPSPVATHTYLFLDDVIRQDRATTLAAGLPANWNTQPADYGLDPRVVGQNGKDSFGGKYTRTLKADLQTLPTLSLVTEANDLFGPQGIYALPENRGSAWERAVSVELIYPDGTKGFQENAGIRIQGGAFRRFDLSLKKSFRVVFRERYGATTLKFPLFGQGAADEFDNFVLRANSNDAWPYGGGSAVYVRDAFAMETARAMGLIVSHSTFAHLYINGFYWGLYNQVERPDAAFSAHYRGGDKDNWDSINQDSAPDGNYDAWNRLNTLLNQDLSQNANFQRLQGNNPDGTRNPAYEDLLDVADMIDYMILNLYVGNTDWPGRNWWAGRDRDNGDGFHFYPWDTETALGLSGLEANVTGVNSAAARPYAAARANAGFRLSFADRVHRHFFNGGPLYVNPARTAWDPAQPENNRPAARFAALAESVNRGIVGESARWGDQLRTTPFTRDEHWLRERNNLITNYFPRRSAIVLEQLRTAGLYPRTVAPVMNRHGGPVDPGFQLTLSAPKGLIYYTTDGTDPRTPGSRQFTGAITLNDLTTVKARVLNATEWSALEEATFVVGAPDLVLTELNYHPTDPTAAEYAAGFDNADSFEFVELFNRGTATADLTGVRFVNGVEFDFTGSAVTRLAAGAYVLVVKNRAAFARRHGAGLPVAGEFTGRFNNAGETVELVRADGSPILTFTYGTLSPWPPAADGAGPSLEVINPKGNLNLPSNWRASTAAGGSPAVANPPPPLRLEATAGEAGPLRVRFDGQANLGYTVLVRASLGAEDWQVFQQGAPLAADQRVEIAIPLPPDTGVRFFQVTVP
jgi:hypothetical protein